MAKAMGTTDANASRNDDLLMLFSLRVFGEVLPSCMKSTESAWTGGRGIHSPRGPERPRDETLREQYYELGELSSGIPVRSFPAGCPTHSRSVRMSGLSLQSDGKRACQWLALIARQP